MHLGVPSTAPEQPADPPTDRPLNTRATEHPAGETSNSPSSPDTVAADEGPRRSQRKRGAQSPLHYATASAPAAKKRRYRMLRKSRKTPSTNVSGSSHRSNSNGELEDKSESEQEDEDGSEQENENELEQEDGDLRNGKKAERQQRICAQLNAALMVTVDARFLVEPPLTPSNNLADGVYGIRLAKKILGKKAPHCSSAECE